MKPRETLVDVGDTQMPVAVLGDPEATVPGIVVIPSIFGPANDLLERLGTLEGAWVAVTDPFFRVGPGPVPYADFQAAFAKVAALDRERCIEDVSRVVSWARGRGNGKIVGLGICFGGPFCLMGAADGWFDGIVTWHGSRMQNYLERASEMLVPMRLHFGSDDKFVPAEVVEQVREAFAGRDDVRIVVHEGCDHGFSHDGAAWNEAAADASLQALQAMVLAV